MISLHDYTSHDGLGLAELVARKEVTPDELTAAAFEAVAKVNPKINAVLHTLPRESCGGNSRWPCRVARSLASRS